MWHLPAKMPEEAYEEIARRSRMPLPLVRAFGVKESHNRQEDPRSLRRENHHWRKRRLNHKAARAFDRKPNSRDTGIRWDQFWEMHDLCELDATLVSPANAESVRWAAVRSHSFTSFQVMGFNDGLCGFNDPANFFKCCETIDGHVKIITGFFRNSKRIVELANRLDQTPRTINTRRGPRRMRLGDFSEISMHYNGSGFERNRYDKDLLQLTVEMGKRYA